MGDAASGSPWRGWESCGLEECVELLVGGVIDVV